MLYFRETPQGIALSKRIDACDSSWQQQGLREVFIKAEAHYNSVNEIGNRIKRMFDELGDSEQEWFLQTLRDDLKRHDYLASMRVDPNPADKENSMSLEDSVLALTKAVEANTAALLKGGGAVATKPATTPKPAAATAVKPTKTREEMSALAVKYRELIGDANGGKEKTQTIIQATGKAAKLKEVADANIDALCAALEAAIAEAEAPPAAGDEM